MNHFEVITSLVGILAVGLTIAIKRRSADDSFSSGVFLRNFLLVTALLIFRQDLQLLIWLILDQGMKTVIDLVRFLREGPSKELRIIFRELGRSFETTHSFSFLSVSFYLQAILPAAAISIARVTGRTTIRKFTYIIVAAIVTFLLIDLVHPPKLPASLPQPFIRFLVIFDFVVGFICGIVFLIFNAFILWASRPVKFVQAHPKLRSLVV